MKRSPQGGEGRPHYWPRFCEENVWHLAGEDRFCRDAAWVAIITNPVRAVAMWFQRAAELPGRPLLWDYHVILLARAGRGDVEVWDLDTVMGLPVSADHYLRASFEAAPVEARLRPQFRLMPAAHYREAFASDRRHMKDGDGAWLAAPPPWATIGDGRHALPELLDLDREGPGLVLDLDGLRRELSC